MKKRFLSLLCALTLCLGLMPATALAADGIELYVAELQKAAAMQTKMELGQRLRAQNLPAVSFITTPPPSPLR